MRIGILVLSMATLAFLIWLGMGGGGGRQRATVDLDPRQGAYADPRRIIARIQSDLDRAAVGGQAWPLPPGVFGDPLEAIVDAYRLFLDGNAKGMDARLKEIAATADTRAGAARGADADTAARAAAYFTRLGDPAAAPGPAGRLLAGLRRVDGILFMEAAGWTEADPQTRVAEALPAVSGTWLRLPCRTVIGRVAELRAAQAELGELAGPLLACPSDNPDLAVLEAQAKAPGMLPTRNQAIPLRAAMPRVEPSAPPAPWDHDTAIAWMDEDPDAAEPALAAAATVAERLDYALFLYAFRPAGPDNQARIHGLLRAVDEARPPGFDGSEDSLVAALRQATAGTAAPGYAIPCAVLLARPGLLAATRPEGDAEAPRSGCASGRGQARGFPAAEVAAFVAMAEEADGHFLARRGTMPAPTQQAALEMLKLAPRQLAEAEPPAMDHPYQVWGLASLGNRAVERRITPLYRDAADRLAAWYRRRGLAADEAARAAKTGLFRVVWGANCGDGAPTPSPRELILDRAPAERIRDALAGKEAPEVTRCAVHAGLDPLPLVAAGHPPALQLLLERGAKPDERNAFGKTALMAAAQADRIDSVRLLLDKGAAVNASTWRQDGPALAHDGRTALMYAAAAGSLPVIKLLLDRGADPHQADTRGRRAIDYLLGFGPVPANAVLSPAERSDAARLLY